MSDQQTESILPIFGVRKNTDDDDRRQRVQMALELAERKYDRFKDKDDKLKKLNSQLLGLCALSGFTSLASQNGTNKTASLLSQRIFLTACFLLLFTVIMTVIFMLLDFLYPLLPGAFDDDKWTTPERLTENAVTMLILRQNTQLEDSEQKYVHRVFFILAEYIMYLGALDGILQYFFN